MQTKSASGIYFTTVVTCRVMHYVNINKATIPYTIMSCYALHTVNSIVTIFNTVAPLGPGERCILTTFCVMHYLNINEASIPYIIMSLCVNQTVNSLVSIFNTVAPPIPRVLSTGPRTIYYIYIYIYICS